MQLELASRRSYRVSDWCVRIVWSHECRVGSTGRAIVTVIRTIPVLGHSERDKKSHLWLNTTKMCTKDKPFHSSN